MNTLNSRGKAAKVLKAVLVHGKTLNASLDEQQIHEHEDSTLIQAFCYGVLRDYFALQAIAKSLVKKPLKDKHQDLHFLLLIGLHQLRSLRVPDHAAIAETVAAAAQLKKGWAKGFLNGTLRSYQRQLTRIEASLADDPEFCSHHPRWLSQAIYQAWPVHCDNILAANNQAPPMTLRTNQQQNARDDYERKLKQANVDYTTAPFSPQGIYLKHPCKVEALPGFHQGLLSIQDEAAQLSGILLPLTADDNVLDACAAPGGKTCHLLETEPSIKLLALDRDSQRLERLKENAKRLQLNLTIKTADARHTDSWWDGTAFQKILLDAPCSGTGVIRRHPDIKLLRRESDIPQFVTQQYELLEALWPLLAEGGTLLYATCSILPQENHIQMQNFLKRHQDAEEEIITATWGINAPVGRQLFPQPNSHDGFYYCRINKKS